MSWILNMSMDSKSGFRLEVDVGIRHQARQLRGEHAHLSVLAIRTAHSIMQYTINSKGDLKTSRCVEKCVFSFLTHSVVDFYPYAF